ncbi:transposase, partial [Intestinibacter sp.]
MKPTVKCPECGSTNLYKYGKDKNSNQKYLCKRCNRQFTEQSSKKYSKNYPK